MSEHAIHQTHEHVHGPGCGHPAVQHDGYVDYLHDGHLHHPHGNHCDDHGKLTVVEPLAADCVG